MKNKVCFITGATSGFGSAIARRFLQAGNHVVITGRRKERLIPFQKEFGDRVAVVHADICNQTAMQQAIDALPEPFSNIDILVNNAGLALGLETADEAFLDDWNTMIDTNIKGLVAVTRAILPGMVKRNTGHIVNLGSIAGTYPYSGGNVYGATKAFVHQFSLNLRADLFGKAIRVTCIEPGLAETEFSLIRFKGETSKAEAPYKDVTPLSAEDIADSVLYVTSLPEHVNINRLELMPVMQSFAGLKVCRTLGPDS